MSGKDERDTAKKSRGQSIVDIFESLEEEYYAEDLKLEKRKKENRATKRIMKGNTK